MALQLNDETLKLIVQGHELTLAKCISEIERESAFVQALLPALQPKSIPCIGITGAPGAGKSTLVNALLHQLVNDGKRIAVVSVDPSSPFNYGALLGDRVRMAAFYTNAQVYIRSLASRGALGGLHPHIFDIVHLLKSSSFDYIILETVGVGQSEVDIAGIADTTIVVVVPEGGDEVQTWKAGVMEIANIFVVNKADRPTANTFVKNLKLLSHSKQASNWSIPVVPTVATKQEGIEQLVAHILEHNKIAQSHSGTRMQMAAIQLWHMLQVRAMKAYSKADLLLLIENAWQRGETNVYKILADIVGSKK